MSYSWVCTLKTSLVLFFHLLKCEVGFFFATIVLVVFYVYMVFEQGEFFEEIVILGEDILVRIACVVGVSDEMLFLGEYFLEYEEPAIVISAFDLGDLYACNHMLSEFNSRSFLNYRLKQFKSTAISLFFWSRMPPSHSPEVP